MTPQAHTDAQAVPRTEAGKRLLDEWAWMRAGHAPNTAKVRDLIVAAEAEAALVTAPDLDVDRLWIEWVEFNDSATRKGSGFTKDQITGARGFSLWLRDRLRAAASPTAHSEDERLIDTHPALGGLVETIELELGLHNPGANWECDCGDQIEGETFDHHVAGMIDYRLTATDGDA